MGELEVILSEYASSPVPVPLDFNRLRRDYELKKSYVKLKPLDLVLVSYAEEEKLEDMLTFRRSKRGYVNYSRLKELSRNTWALVIPEDYEKDKILNYLLAKGQEKADGLSGMERVRAIGEQAYKILVEKVLKKYDGVEKDGFVYGLEYLFYNGSVECVKIAATLSLVLSLDKKTHEAGIQTRFGGKFIDVYDPGKKKTLKNLKDSFAHAWVNVYSGKDTYIFDPLHGVFADKKDAKDGIMAENEMLVYHYNNSTNTVLRKHR